MTLDPRTHARILTELSELAATRRLDRKLLVCPHESVGQELLRALALAGVDWIHFEPTSPAALAAALTEAVLAAEGLAFADAFQERALVDDALDEVLAGVDPRAPPRPFPRPGRS